jgi:hypothetical protein
MDPRWVVTAIQVGRAVAGAGLLAAPARAGSGWIGPVAEQPATQVFARGFGARDAGLALGTLAALRNGDSVRTWLWAGVLSDAADCAATAAAGRSLPPAKRNLALAVAAGAALTGVWAARALS